MTPKLADYLKFYGPPGFARLSDDAIRAAINENPKGATTILMKGLMREIAVIEVLAAMPIPGKEYDQTLFKDKPTLKQFVLGQVQDEAIGTTFGTLLELLDGAVVEQSTSLAGLGSLMNVYGTGMTLATYYRDHVMLPGIEDGWQKTYSAARAGGATPKEALAEMRKSSNDQY